MKAKKEPVEKAFDDMLTARGGPSLYHPEKE